MNQNFDNTVNAILVEKFADVAAAGILGFSALAGTPSQGSEPASIRQTNQDSFLSSAFDYIKEHEGLRLKPYKDSKGILTIGIGHKILPGEDFSKGITKTEALQLFQKDVQKHLSVAKKLFPSFDSYPDYLKIALLDGVYRGDHKSKYRTTKLINNGNFAEAAREYLNHNDYRESRKKDSGVWKRMEKNSKAIEKYSKELK